MLGGCPILWKSQLQTEISLLTLESEYSALSASMQTLLPLRSLLGEIVKELKQPPDFKSTINCRVFEDNNGALLLATKQRITNRTKYFMFKWNFFWHHVTNGDVQVLKIATTDQLADYLTKGLNRKTFERIRKLAQGWWHAVLGPHICWADFRRALSLILVSPSVPHSCLFLHYIAFHCMRGRVDVPGRDVDIPVLFVPQILSCESETRMLNSSYVY